MQEDSSLRMEKLSHGLRVLKREFDKCKRIFYELQDLWEKELQCQKNERRGRAVVLIIQKHKHKWLLQRAYLKILSVTTFI
ncbi:hypothetical protein IMY05_011G0062900 [Salix suchowensis]|nr:hypothetical protein IMY05_011G0062900 [Salix suchowensis]